MIMASNFLTRVPPLFSDLAKILEGEIDCSHATLTKYSNDGSPYAVLPQAVIYPKNVTDIKHVLSFAREYKMPVATRGKGTARTGGSLSEGIVLDMTRYFSHIRNINMVENTVTVDAGVTLSSFLEKLHAWHFDIPLLTGNDPETTIGALIATKSAQAGSFHHGTIREWVEGLSVVVDNGEEHHIADGITPSGRLLGIYQSVFPLLTKENPTLRASKPKSNDDATGYNLWNTSIGPRQLIDQLTGSEGTLGIIISVTFRISPYKPHRITTCIPLSKKNLLAPCIDIAKHHKGEYMFLYDEAMMELAERYHPMVVPFFLETPYVLLVTHTGTDLEKLHHSVRTFRSALPIEDYLLKTIEDEKQLARITSNEFLFSLFKNYTNDALVPVTFAEGLVVGTHHLSSLLQDLEEYLNSLGKLYSISGNIGSGHVSVVTFFDQKAKHYDEELLSYAKEIFTIIKQYNGGISATSGEGLARAPYLNYIYNDGTLAVFKKIKDAWDPLSILNPGKKIGATTSYLTQHVWQDLKN
jgi:FAD/FMN-containing dehydrogenase